MPRRADFPDFLGGLPHTETTLYYPVLDGLGHLDREVARREMEATPAAPPEGGRDFEGHAP